MPFQLPKGLGWLNNTNFSHLTSYDPILTLFDVTLGNIKIQTDVSTLWHIRCLTFALPQNMECFMNLKKKKKTNLCDEIVLNTWIWWVVFPF